MAMDDINTKTEMKSAILPVIRPVMAPPSMFCPFLVDKTANKILSPPSTREGNIIQNVTMDKMPVIMDAVAKAFCERKL